MGLDSVRSPQLPTASHCSVTPPISSQTTLPYQQKLSHNHFSEASLELSHHLPCSTPPPFLSNVFGNFAIWNSKNHRQKQNECIVSHI